MIQDVLILEFTAQDGDGVDPVLFIKEPTKPVEDMTELSDVKSTERL